MNGMPENASKEKLISTKSDQMMTWEEQTNMVSETSPNKEINKECLEFQLSGMIYRNPQDKVSQTQMYLVYHIELCRWDNSSRAVIP